MIMKAMRNIYRLLCAAAAISLTSACSKDYMAEVWNAVEIDGPYIQEYYDGPLKCEVLDIYGGMPFISVSIDTEHPSDIKKYSSWSTGDEAEIYRSLCQKHNDLNFKGEDPLFNHPSKQCYAKDIASIELTCDSDFDAKHPAGSSIMDIMEYQTTSFGPFITSGYGGEFNNYNAALNRIQISISPADSIAPEYMMLLSSVNLFRLFFNCVPERKTEIGLTLTITFDNETAVTFNVTADFSDYQG